VYGSGGQSTVDSQVSHASTGLGGILDTAGAA
jgi:hypothetical protein